MTPLHAQNIESKLTSPSTLSSHHHPETDSHVAPLTPQRQRLTKRGQSQIPDPISNSKQSQALQASPRVEKLGQGTVTIKGRRIRCKMCRRELAARDHILSHEPGRGQSAFAPQKRDMTKFREEAMKKLRSQNLENMPSPLMASRNDELIDIPTEAMESTDEIPQPLSGLASLRVSMPPRSSDSLESESTISPLSSDQKPFKPTNPSSSPPLLSSHECSSYFVEPLSWMATVLEKGELVGKIICPNPRCVSKLGNFDWAGCQCSCGAWITPGFQVDWFE